MRQRTAQLYSEFLQDQEDIMILPRAASDRSHVYHLYVIQHPQRDALLASFHEQGISTGIHYPLPVHLQPCYEHLNVPRGSLPITESLASRVLSLPMFPEISVEQVQHVCHQLTKSYKHVRKGAAYSHS
jgi:dTDP-4-amino-4,6-dideoxygalactose transaminase